MEINEIQSIALSQLPNGNHIEFNKESYAIITSQEAVAEEFADKMAAWHTAIQEEDRVMEKISFSELTKRIADADKDRDTLYDMFMRIVKAYLGYTEAPKREAAEKIDRYDRVNKVETGQQYDRETGNMENFIQDMRSYCSAEVELLGLTAVLGQMDEKNQLVRQLLLERNEEYVDNKHVAVKEARRVTDDAYELLRKFINASALLKGVSPYLRTIELMNQNIERTKQQVFKKTGQAGVDGGATDGTEGSEGSEGSEGEEEEQQPTTYTLTFTHNGETVSTQQLEAGAAITPPAAPTGYHWVNVPATMPAENLTIHSAEDEEEEPPILS